MSLVMTTAPIDTRVMTKLRMSFRFEDSDVMTWKEYAEASGLTLSEWIRLRCNDQVSYKEPDAPRKSCPHGMEVGWRCTLCGGIVK